MDSMTPPEEAVLIVALDRALLVAERARSTNWGLFFQMLVLRDDPDHAPLELRELLTVISATPALECFDHADQCALGNQERVGFRFLVQWLISRAQQVGAERAISDLSRYLASDTLDVTVVLAVDGIDIEGKIELGDHELIPWRELADSDTKWQIAALGAQSGSAPSAALIQRHEIKRMHIRPWDQQEVVPPLSIEPTLDVLRCVMTIAGAGVRRLHYWVEPPEWAPWAVSRSGFGVDSSVLVHDVKLEQLALPKLVQCASRFLAMSDSNRQRLRVPLDRLNRSYLVAMRSVDSAIELGVAIESLYAPSKLSEGIAFAVRTRAARFLGGSVEQRHTTASTLRDVYDLRSLAVHAGRFDTESASKKWRDDTRVRLALKQGREIVAQSLMKMIEESEPVWEDFDIGASNPDGKQL